MSVRTVGSPGKPAGEPAGDPRSGHWKIGSTTETADEKEDSHTVDPAGPVGSSGASSPSGVVETSSWPGGVRAAPPFLASVNALALA